MARYYLTVPRKYNENDWLLSDYYGNGTGLVPPGFRMWNGHKNQPDLKEGEAVYCPFCLDEMGRGIGCGDESLDYCHTCEVMMEGEAQVILDEDERNYIYEFNLGTR